MITKRLLRFALGPSFLEPDDEAENEAAVANKKRRELLGIAEYKILQSLVLHPTLSRLETGKYSDEASFMSSEVSERMREEIRRRGSAALYRDVEVNEAVDLGPEFDLNMPIPEEATVDGGGGGSSGTDANENPDLEELSGDLYLLIGLYTAGIATTTTVNWFLSMLTMNAMVYKYPSYRRLASSCVSRRRLPFMFKSFSLEAFNRIVMNPVVSSCTNSWRTSQWFYYSNPGFFIAPLLTYPLQEYIDISCLGLSPPSLKSLYASYFLSPGFLGRMLLSLSIDKLTDIIALGLKYFRLKTNEFVANSPDSHMTSVRELFVTAASVTAVSELLTLPLKRGLYISLRNTYASTSTSGTMREVGCNVTTLLLSIAANQCAIFAISAICHFADGLLFIYRNKTSPKEEQ